MKQLALAAFVSLSFAAPTSAQTAQDFAKEFERFSKEAQEFFGELAENLAPMIEGFQEKIGDLNQYHPPEILPNGDIIIRRKEKLDTPKPSEDNGAVEL